MTQPTDPWLIEDEAIVQGLDDHVYELAACVECPAELGAHRDAADADPAFLDDHEEWFAYVHNRGLLLPVEQSCSSEGMLLVWDMRAVRLQTLPPGLLSGLHFFFEKCPRHTQAMLVHYTFWLVRFERIQRRGTPSWTVADVIIPDYEEPAFFRPDRLRTRSSAR